MYSGTRLFSDIARERYAEMGYLWRIADIFFFFALKWRPLCKALYENALIYFQSPAASIHMDAADQACVALRHVWLYSGFPALITRLQRSLQRFPRINVRPPFARHRVAAFSRSQVVSLLEQKDYIQNQELVISRSLQLKKKGDLKLLLTC